MPPHPALSLSLPLQGPSIREAKQAAAAHLVELLLLQEGVPADRFCPVGKKRPWSLT